MRTARRVFPAWLAGVLLAGSALTGCGGGADGHKQQAGAGLAIAAFADMARGSACADIRNRLFIIDDKQVFWDRAGNCPDMAYEQVLYGATPQDVLCSHADSIAGPRTACKDEGARALFDTIVQNAARDDLGIGYAHTVERVSLLAPGGSAAAFTVLDTTQRSNIHAPRTVVIKDAGAWASLWAEHAGAGAGTGSAAPAVDFSTSMVVGVFLGERPSACYTTAITKVTRGGAGIVVQHTDTVPGMGVACATVITTPAALAVIGRSDLPVDFVAKIVPVR